MYQWTRFAGATAAIALLSGAAVASAQNRNANPNFGETTLDGGFTPDPYTVDIQAGGSIDASRLGSSCRGRISSAPDFRLTYNADRTSGLPLRIRAISQDGRDITLVVNNANGGWNCDDDSLGGLNPEITYDNPRAGVYEIWLGTYSGGNLSSARLEISELEYGNNTDGDSGDTNYTSGNRGSGLSSALDTSARTVSGTYTLNSGFTPDPRRYNVTAGGAIKANDYDGRCSGFVKRSPDVRINYTSGSLPLVLTTNSSSDTTIIVNDANGNWYCDDDGGEGLNARVAIQNPNSGQFDVWIGSYDGNSIRTQLLVSELTSTGGGD